MSQREIDPPQRDLDLAARAHSLGRKYNAEHDRERRLAYLREFLVVVLRIRERRLAYLREFLVIVLRIRERRRPP